MTVNKPAPKHLAFRSLILPALLLVISAYAYFSLGAWRLDLGQREYLFLSYSTQVCAWLSATVLIDRTLKVFFWYGLFRRNLHNAPPRLLVDLASIMVFVFGITGIASVVFGIPLTGFWATSGIVGLVLGFALRNIIMDLFTGIAVNIDKPYRVGDWVQVQGRTPEQDLMGRITEINWRTTRIEKEECSVIVVPNSLLSTMTLINLSSPERRTRFEVHISLDHAVKVDRAKRVLTAALKSVASEPGFLTHPAPNVIVDVVGEMGVSYKLRYWILPWEGISPSNAQDVVLARALAHLSQAGITPAYPKEDLFVSHVTTPRNFDSLTISGKCELMKRVDLLSPLDNEELVSLAERLREVVSQEGEELITAGDDAVSMFILVEGLMDVVSFRSGQPRIVAQIEPGNCIGEMALFGGMKRAASVRAVTKSVSYEIAKEDLNELFSSRPEILERVSAVLSTRLAEREKRIAADQALATITADAGESSSPNAVLSRLKSIFSPT